MWADDCYDRNSPISDAPGKLSASYLATGYLRVYKITVYNSNAGSQYVLIFDASTLPADAAVPLMVKQATTKATVEWVYEPSGRIFRRGVSLCNSSTDTTKTIGAADCFFEVVYDFLPTPPSDQG